MRLSSENKERIQWSADASDERVPDMAGSKVASTVGCTADCMAMVGDNLRTVATAAAVVWEVEEAVHTAEAAHHMEAADRAVDTVLVVAEARAVELRIPVMVARSRVAGLHSPVAVKIAGTVVDSGQGGVD